jgi:hypothetical protein
MKLLDERHARLIGERQFLIIQQLLGAQESCNLGIGSTGVEHSHYGGRNARDVN